MGLTVVPFVTSYFKNCYPYNSSSILLNTKQLRAFLATANPFHYFHPLKLFQLRRVQPTPLRKLPYTLHFKPAKHQHHTGNYPVRQIEALKRVTHCICDPFVDNLVKQLFLSPYVLCSCSLRLHCCTGAKLFNYSCYSFYFLLLNATL